MPRILPWWTILLPLIVLLLIVPSCQRPDDRLVEVSHQSCERQARQNETIAQQTQQVTETTRQFVESSSEARRDLIELQRELANADAEAREDLLAVQQNLVDRDAQGRQELDALQRETHNRFQTERSSIDRQREDLEVERRKIAKQRVRVSVVAAVLTQLGTIVACLLPLLLAGYLLYVTRGGRDNDEAVTELLIEELVADRPRLLLPGPAAKVRKPALSAPASSSTLSDDPS